MIDVQIAHAVPTNGFNPIIIRSLLNPIIRYEDNDQWNSTDVLIVRTINLAVYTSRTSNVTMAQLVKRIEELSWIKLEYVTERLPKLLRSPPNTMDGVVPGIVLRY
jgi:hypothetical protein